MITLYDAHRGPVRALFRLLARPRAEGIERMPRQGGVVVVSNHLTMLDPFLLAALFPRQCHFMTKEELFRFAPLGWYLHHSGAFPIRRGEVDRAALRHAEDLLRAGRVVMIFPEGHRSDTAGAREARTGAVLLATRTGTPILPVAIAGTERLRLRPIQGQSRWSLLSWPRVRVSVGEPLWIDRTPGSAGRKAAADLVMRRIVALLPPAYHGVYGAGGGESQ